MSSLSYHKYYPTHYTNGYWYYGAERISRDQVQAKSLAVYRDKVSVDTGTFVPGVYRVNPYDIWHEETEVQNTPYQEFKWGSWPYFLRSEGYTAAACLTAALSPNLPSEATDLMQQALTKARAKISSSDLSLGEDLGELRETLAMLKSPLSGLREFLQQNNRRNLKKIKSLLEFLKTGTFGGKRGKGAAAAAANTWLELRYGFRPLIMLVGDLMEAVNRKSNSVFDPNVIRSVRAKVSMDPYKESSGYSSISTIWQGATGYPGYYNYVVTVELEAFAQVQYLQTNPLTVLQRLGLTPRFWPEIVWELTNLSYVWDWFTNIGSWLGSLRVNPEITILGNTTAVKMVRTKEVTLDKIKVDPSVYAPWAGSGSRKIKRYKRFVNTELPLTPSVRLDNGLDVNKLIDALSLIIQRIFR